TRRSSDLSLNPRYGIRGQGARSELNFQTYRTQSLLSLTYSPHDAHGCDMFDKGVPSYHGLMLRLDHLCYLVLCRPYDAQSFPLPHIVHIAHELYIHMTTYNLATPWTCRMIWRNL